jgi:type IV pilus assembly protein PilC
MDSFVLHIPIITPLVKETNAARTARTLSSLLASGVPITEAIGITKEVMQNSHYKKVLEDAGIAIQKGEPLSKVFLAANHLYPDFVGEMMAVGEETGKVSDMFMKVATFYEEEVDQKTKDMSTIIEPFLMVFIGASVGFFAIAMISPTYSLVDVIN